MTPGKLYDVFTLDGDALIGRFRFVAERNCNYVFNAISQLKWRRVGVNSFA